MLKRSLYYEALPQVEHKNAIIICGMRQVGKTSLMRILFNEINAPKLLFDFDNPLDQIIFEAVDYNQIFNDLKKLVSIKEGERLFVFIDEIQNYPDITKVIKYLIDHYRVKFIVTGSSNFYLRNLFPESLTGRKFLYTLKPLSFSEFLYFRGKEGEESISELKRKSLFKKHSRAEFEKRRSYYDEYVEYGGFPEVALTPDISTRQLVLRNIFSSFFEKDIRIFTELKEVRELRDMILLLAPRNGNTIDISRIASELGISRVKVYSYIEYLQGIFFLKLVSKHTGSIDKSVTAGKKVYFSDTGILNMIARVTEGQLFETAVCNQLDSWGNLSFYNKRNSAEIDFILNSETALEVKMTAVKNDIEKLKKLSGTLNINDYYVISRKYSDMDRIVFAQFI